jgi:bacillithiol synthase
LANDCIAFRDIPHASRLFLDFLAYAPGVQAFYAAPEPLSQPVSSQSANHRNAVCDVLLRQNQSFGASPKTLENIERLRSGTNAIVTGQQVGLFGGPLLAILKALSAVKLAAQRNAVPVFWMATTDHDLAEIDHAKLICDGKLTRVAASLIGQPGAVVSRATIHSDPVSEIERCYPEADPEALAWLRECYRPGERIGIAFARLWSRLFAEYGLVLIDPDDAALHRIAAPLYTQAAAQSLQLQELLRDRSNQLQAGGYHEQVLVTDTSTLLFVEVEGIRTPVRVVRELTGETKLRAGSLEWPSVENFAAWIEASPSQVTPNALLRPVVQDYFLPTLAYIGGPAEIAYFAQSTVLYEALLGGRTPVLPRASASVLEPRVAHVMERHRLPLRELLHIHSEAELALRFAEQELPAHVTETFAQTRQCMEQDLAKLASVVEEEDVTLRGAAANSLRKIRHQIAKLEERAARARLRREETLGRHAKMLWNNLRPEHQLQEREISCAHYLLRYGLDFPAILADHVRPTCVGHQIIHL